MNNSFLKNLFVWFIIFASLMGAYQIISEGKKQYSDLKYSEFLNVVESDQVLQVEIKGNNNHPPDPYHGKTIMNWLNANKSLEVDDSAKEDLIGGGIVQLEDGTWGTFLDKAEFEVIDTLSNGAQITIIKNV